jgi:hypothetical protein
MTNAPKSRDYLTTTTDENKIELTELELSRAAGDRNVDKFLKVAGEFLKTELDDTLFH